jgi:hypothetical protein
MHAHIFVKCVNTDESACVFMLMLSKEFA